MNASLELCGSNRLQVATTGFSLPRDFFSLTLPHEVFALTEHDLLGRLLASAGALPHEGVALTEQRAARNFQTPARLATGNDPAHTPQRERPDQKLTKAPQRNQSEVASRGEWFVGHSNPAAVYKHWTLRGSFQHSDPAAVY